MEMASAFSLPLSVFISYANEDENLLQEFEKHLNMLKRRGLIRPWHHRNVLAGMNKQQKIDEHLLSASLILLLISSDFFNSDECEREMQQAITCHKTNNTLVIPILLRSTTLKGTPCELLVCLPRDKVKSSLDLWENKDVALKNIVEEIDDTIQQYLAPQNKQLSEKEKRLRALIPDHHGFLYDRLESFVGRQKELAEIRENINKRLPTGGYVTITGQAGQGKSSIIAKLIELYGVKQVAYHFIPLNPGPDHQVGLLRNLIAHLILKYGLSDLYVASDNRAALRDYFPKVLTEVANQDGQEIIFIDGLDQLEEDFNGVRDLSFLPTDPPLGIVFVLGTRPNDTMKPLELLKPLDQYLLPNISRQDFNLILKHRRVSLEKHLADRFYQAMEENALYLDLVAKELNSSGAIEPLAMIKRITANPANIFSISIEHLKQKGQIWEMIIYPVLGVLLTVQCPISLASIKDILHLEDYKLRDGLKKLGGLLTEDTLQKYSLLHLKLRDYLRQDMEKPQKEYVFSVEEEEGWHARLAVWCEQRQLSLIWQDVNNPKEQERRIYARQHYITHLFHARKWQQLFDVLDEGIYGRAKVQYDPSTRSYVQDLDRGRQAVVSTGETLEEKIAILPHLWRYTLLRSILRSHANQYSREMFLLLLLLGREADVLGLAELLTDPLYKIEVLLLMAGHLVKSSGSKTDIAQIFLRVFEVAKSIEGGDERVKALSNLASVLAQAGQWEQAQQVAQAIEDGDERAKALSNLASVLAQAGQWEQAQQVAQAIEEEYRRTEALSNLASVLAQARQWEQAQQVAQSIEEEYRRTKALSILASALAQAKQWKQAQFAWIEAQQVARLIEDGNKRAEALSVLANALAQARQWKQALRVAQSIEGDYRRTEVLSSLANALAQARQWKQALQVAQSIEGDYRRTEVLSSLVGALIQAGQWEQAQHAWIEAQQVARLIEDRNKRLEALINVLAQARQWEQAQQVAQSIEDKNKRAEALSSLASALALVGQWEQAQQMAQSIEDGNERAEALKTLASILVRAEKWEQAQQVVQLIEDKNKHAEALSRFASILVQARRWEQAQQVAQLIGDKNKRVEVLCSLACLLARDQQKKRAEMICTETERIIRLVEEDYLRLEALSSLASALTQAGQWKQAQQVAQSIEDGNRRTEVLGSVASALTQSGQWEQAQQVAQSIEDGGKRAKALSGLASALDQAGQWEQAQQVWIEAQQLAQSMEDRNERLEALINVLTQSGQWEQAQQAAQSIEEESRRLEVFSILISALAQAGQWEQAQQIWIEARQVTRFIKRRNERVQALSLLASSLGPWRQAKWIWIEAQQVAQAIEDGNEHAEVLSGLANALTRSGQWEQAWQMIRSIEDRNKYMEALSNLVSVLTQSKQWEQARQMIQSIEDRNKHMEALGSLASALTRSGQWEQAQQVAQSIGDGYRRAKALSSLASALAQVGQWEQAQQVARLIEDGNKRAEVLSMLTSALAQVEQREQAQPVTYSMESDYLHTEAWSFFSLSLAQMGQRKQSQPVAHPREQRDEKTKALSVFASISLSVREYELLISEIHSLWLQVETRRDALRAFSLALRFISLQPEIGIGFYDGFKWVDTFWDR